MEQLVLGDISDLAIEARPECRRVKVADMVAGDDCAAGFRDILRPDGFQPVVYPQKASDDTPSKQVPEAHVPQQAHHLGDCSTVKAM